MDGDNHLLSKVVTVTQGNMAANLMVPIPAYPTEGTNQALPRKIPGEFAHAPTSTVHSDIAASSGNGSPCLRLLSR